MASRSTGNLASSIHASVFSIRLALLTVTVLCLLLSGFPLSPRCSYASVLQVDVIAAAKDADDGFTEMRECKGRTADEALEKARSIEMPAKFKDSEDADVTKTVEDKSNRSDVHGAKVTEVKTHDYWIFGKSVTFVLDYVDQDAKNERDEKAAKEEAKKKATEEIKSCEGKTAAEIKALADAAEYEATFLDSYDVDVTESVAKAKNGSDIAKAKAKEVEVGEPLFFIGGSVKAKLDYVDPAAKKEREAEELRKKTRAEVWKLKGKDVGSAQEFVEKNGYALKVNDKYDTDITDEYRKAKKDSASHKAKVVGVGIDDNAKPPCVTLKINYSDASGDRKRAQKSGNPYELTYSNLKIYIEDQNPTSGHPTYNVTVRGAIKNHDKWDIEESRLPELIYTSAENKRTTGISLDSDEGVLKAGETRGFAYSFEVYGDNARIGMVAPSGTAVHGTDLFAETFVPEFEGAKNGHNITYAAAQEEQQRQQEERERSYAVQRSQATCYYTATGECYHSSSGCPALSRSRNIYSTTISEAQSWGLRPCQRCH